LIWQHTAICVIDSCGAQSRADASQGSPRLQALDNNREADVGGYRDRFLT